MPCSFDVVVINITARTQSNFHFNPTKRYNSQKKDKTFGAAVGKERELFVKDGRLDMQKVLERFSFHYGDTFEKRRVQRGSRLNEDDARISFLMFLIPIINGTGHYYVETGMVDRSRMDVVVDYNGEQFIVEL